MSRLPLIRAVVAVSVLFGLACKDNTGGQVQQGDPGPQPPEWHFETVNHGAGDMTLTDVWGRSDGAIYAVGWYGTILTNRITPRNPQGQWVTMVSGTVEHLTAIYGVENGGAFNQPSNVDGEMFAVGWNGTLLHYHPNPTDLPEPTPDDGAWQAVAGPSLPFSPKVKVDAFCPDYDGDGIPDDGGSPAGSAGGPGPDGWWSSDATCVNGATASCDDNCRKSPNGTMRPMVDGNADGCLEYGNGADGPNAANAQDENPDGDAIIDADGVGAACDDNDNVVAEPARFTPTLFDVWADAPNGTDIMVIAVGEDGALISYNGPNSAQVLVPPQLPVTDPLAWTAQADLPYRYINDCAATTPVGQSCGGDPVTDPNASGRLPPSCPAQCSPYRTDCDCAPTMNQCCSADGSLTGAAGPNGAAANACDAATGGCSTLCPGCFRRLTKTLRAVAVDPGSGTVVAVGATGAIVQNNVGTLDGTWDRPDCPAAPSSMVAEARLLTSLDVADGVFHIVGAAGSVLTYDANATAAGTTNPCPMTPQCGAPPGFMSGVFSLAGGAAYVVGDQGLLLDLDTGRLECNLDSNNVDCLDPRLCTDADADGVIGQPVMSIDNKVSENVNAIWRTRVQGPDGTPIERFWLVGASGIMVKAGYY